MFLGAIRARTLQVSHQIVASGTRRTFSRLAGINSVSRALPMYMIGYEVKESQHRAIPFTGANKDVISVDVRSTKENIRGHNDGLEQGYKKDLFCVSIKQMRRRKMNKHKLKKRIRRLRNSTRARKTVSALKRIERARERAKMIISYGTHTTNPVRARDR